GWGVMIPQPFDELKKRANEIRLYALSVIVAGVLVAAVLGWFLTGYLAKPVLAVVNAARRMAAGERSARVGVISKHAPEEFEILRKNFNSMADAIADSLNKLTRLAETVSRIDGEDTFRQLIGNLVEISGADIALVGESPPDDDAHIRTLSLFVDGAEAPNTTYAIAGTPYEKVATGKDCVYASGAQDMFPGDPILKDWNIESYVGIPLLDPQQKVTGVIAIMFRGPEEHIGVIHDLLRIMANRAESELNRQRVESERLQALFEAQQANRAKTDFLANMSHEFRTPLNSILGFSSILSSEMFGPHADERYLEYSKNINESGAHLLEIITDILDISKIEAGEVTVEEIEIDHHNMLTACCSMVSQRARQADVTVELKKSKDIPKLLADERQVKQIVLNLLANAVKFTPPGGKVVISIGLNDKDEIGISITDTGIGIAAEDIPKILEPFGQVADIMSRHHGGTGLGLPICKSLIDLHGGRLEIDSAIKTGTTVTVVFPATRTSRATA
ncbi:MAG TPA: hybrid sensor histidine kinase/response regulator, partial [Rhodospirillales bacterium]|nr:hybrid sensor histidine kinase/response regulator [Rhodospirillales bacterium]